MHDKGGRTWWTGIEAFIIVIDRKLYIKKVMCMSFRVLGSCEKYNERHSGRWWRELTGQGAFEFIKVTSPYETIVGPVVLDTVECS